jgi:tetratricopeptide (TPR) repeat protein
MRLMLGTSFVGNEEAGECFRRARSLYAEARDTRGEALCLAWMAWCDVDMAMAERCALADRGVALARAGGDPWTLSFCLKLAHSYLARPDEAGADRVAALEESIRLARETGDPFLLCQALHGMGDVYMSLRDDRAAEPWYLECLERARAIGDIWSAFDTKSHLAWGYMNRGDAESARASFADALREAADAGARSYMGQFLHGMATIARNEGRHVDALRLGGAASTFRYYGQTRWDPRLTEGTGMPRGLVEKEWTVGSVMAPNEAVRYALGGGGG